jgi:hypothetical protein
MAKHAVPDVPFIEARNVGTAQKPTAIVLRMSSTTSEQGAALAIATYHHSPISPMVSHHFIVDAVSTYRCVPDSIAAYQNPYRSLSVLICAQPHEYNPFYENDDVSRVLDRSTALVADLLLSYKIPVRYLDTELEGKWIAHKWRRRGGIIVKARGIWPYETFLSLVKLKIYEKTTDSERVAHD